MKKLMLLALVILATQAKARDTRKRNIIKPLGNTTVSSSENKTDVINIVGVSQDFNEVSHNKFDELDLTSNIIFNNSNTTGQSILGGQVQGNQNLSSGEAKTIIAEVYGGNKTNINGSVEIFGRTADLIIANQNGVNINGANFINTLNTTITTGKVHAPIIFEPSTHLEINKGNITVGKDGIKTDGNLSLISKEIALDGDINTTNGNINIIAGNNNVELLPFNNNIIVTSTNNLTSSSHSVGIVGNGSMYGDRIAIINSNKNSDIKLNGTIKSTSSTSITAAGKIESGNNSKIIARDNVEILGKNILNKGEIKSKENALNISSIDKVENNGILSGNNIFINGDTVENNGNIIGNDEIIIHGNKVVNNNNIQTKTPLYSSGVSINGINGVENFGKIEGNKIAIDSFSKIENKGQILSTDLSLNSIGGNIINNGKIESDTINIVTNETFENTGEIKVNLFGDVIAKNIIKSSEYSGNGLVNETLINSNNNNNNNNNSDRIIIDGIDVTDFRFDGFGYLDTQTGRYYYFEG